MMGNLNMNGYRIKGLPTPDVPESNSDVTSWLQIVNLVRNKHTYKKVHGGKRN